MSIKYDYEVFAYLSRPDDYGNGPYMHSTVSCGLREIDVACMYGQWFERHSPGDSWEFGSRRLSFFSHLYKFIDNDSNPGGVLLSDVTESSGDYDSELYAAEFVAYLRKKKARVFDCGPAYYNPNSGNGIQVWLWLPKKTKLVLKEDVTHE